MRRDGPWTAVVVNNVDPLALGRVQVQIPALSDRLLPWARLLVPRAGPAEGIFFRPEVGDEVVVDFLNGNIDEPVVLGGLWSAGNPPPIALVGQSIIRTRSGHTLVFNDADEAACVEITTSGGHSILLSDELDSSRIEISNGSNDSRIVIDDTGHILITADSEGITLRAGQGDVVIEGVNIRLSAQAQLDISGTAGVGIESQAATQLSGALVQLDGSLLVNGLPLP